MIVQEPDTGCGMTKAAVRCAGIKTLARGPGGLGASEDHGKRLDEVSRKRIVRSPRSLAWSKAENALDLIDAFKSHKKETGARERKNSEIGMHQLVMISPEWLGDGHDPENDKVQKLIEESLKWVESWQGEGAVFAWRYDLDERGSGVVDIFSAPVRAQGRNNGKKVLTISPNMAKTELAKKYGEKKSGAAMQTSWAKWAQRTLDRRIERGARKEDTQREHIHAETYSKIASEIAKEPRQAIAAKEKALEIQKKKLDRREARVAEKEAKRENRRGLVWANLIKFIMRKK